MLLETTKISLSNTTPVFLETNAWKRLGLIVLSTDLTTERDYNNLLKSDELGLYTARVVFENPTTPENLLQMAPRLTEAARLLPNDGPLAAICYSCTAASVVIGDEVVRKAIQEVFPDTAVITPSQSAINAFSALNVSKISVLTPYLIETSEPMLKYFEERGLSVQNFECFGMDDDREMARVDQQSIIEAACAVDTPDTQAIFISCTALPAIGAIAEIEERLGKPVVTSNQATAWAMLQHSQLKHMPQGYGKLFDAALKTD